MAHTVIQSAKACRAAVLRHLHIRPCFLAAILISFGGFLNGYDTGSIGAVTEMPYFIARIGHLSPNLRGLTVSILLLAGAVPSLFAGVLADKAGHVNIVMLGALMLMLGAAFEAGAVNLGMLLVGRILVGAGEGLYLGNMNVYICEIAPKSRRGTLASMPQFLATAGTCAGYFTCYGSIRIQSEIQWRLPFIIEASGGALLALFCFFLPESPRWLLTRGDTQRAVQCIQKLGLTQDELGFDYETELSTAAAGDPSEQTATRPPTSFNWGAIADMFRPQYRLRTILGLFILGMVQLCGIDGVLYYAPTLFAQAGLSSATASFVASGVVGIMTFAISIPAFLFADRFGRRTLVITGGGLLAMCMLVIGSLYASSEVIPGRGAGRWVVIVLIFVFSLSYASTWAIVGKVYASEIQPPHIRATANSLAMALNFFTNFLVALITPVFLAQSPSGPYFLFFALVVFTVSVLAIWMPETRHRSLESIQETFKSPFADVFTDVMGRLRKRS